MVVPAPLKRPGIETKVQAGTAAATVAGAIVYLLQTYVFKGTVNAGLVSLVYAAVPGALALAAGYLAPHTPRPVPPAAAVLPGNVTITPVPPLPPPTGNQV
jgi:hypothetical protein